MMREVMPFILCGGAGTRLWPLSREAFPKQFHRLTGQSSLFQQTCRRLTGDLFGDLSILSNYQHRFLIQEQLQEIGVTSADIILEPIGRNTAAAACTAAVIAGRTDPETLVLLAPSDHAIGEDIAFTETVSLGVEAARQGSLVTFGVKPDCPHTGYGYIETVDGSGANTALPVKRFVEKPSREIAETYIDSGRFYWNAGIFLFKASTLLELFQVYAPDIIAACRQALNEAARDLGFRQLGPSYRQAPSISLDYAIMEKAPNIVCVPLLTSWSDVGSWSELWSFLEKDAQGNVAKGDGKILLQDSNNNFAYSDQVCVSLIGVENLVVVAMGDAVLVASKDSAELIKSLVDHLKQNGSQDLVSQHNRVYRPWGWYQGLNRGDRYQVKCIMVKPGGILSLQSHHHRSEHWVVVRGTLEVTKGDEKSLLTENQSTYIAIGEKHRLANPGKIPAFLIEVQSGPYLDEDDITRFEDIYNRD